MYWLTKALAFKVFSNVPFGTTLYGFVQHHVTHSTDVTDPTVLQKLQVAGEYLSFLDTVPERPPLHQFLHIDVGAGWLPIIPFYLYCCGVGCQELLDIRRNITRRAVAALVPAMRRLLGQPGPLAARVVRELPIMGEQEELDSYLGRLNIRYHIVDRMTGFSEYPSPKLVTFTQCLQHFRPELVQSALSGLGCLFGPSDIVLATLRLYDIYSDSDTSLSCYNKWRYSDFVWERVVNSRLMYFNRLTCGDYERLLRESGLAAIAFRPSPVTESERDELARVPVHQQFAGLAQEALAPKHLFWAARGADR